MEYSPPPPGDALLSAPWMVVCVLAVAFVTIGWLYARQRRLGRAMRTELDAMTTRVDEAEDAGIPGVVSRQRFDTLLDEAAVQCDRGERSLSLLFIHLDNLQTVNDAFGYLCGDRAIVQLAERLIGEAGPRAVLARLGGDAFVLMADAPLDAARELAASVVTVRSGGDGIEPELLCSVGVANYPLHGSRARVVGHASTAMRAVRQVGGADFAVFDPSMAIDLKEQTELLRDLRHAVSRGELAMVYQPKVDAKTLQITAAEALLRWHHPQRGLISPGIFIPLAERFGLIGPIGNWVIDEACRQAGVWRSAGLRMRVAINISAYQMRQDDLVDRLEAALAANGLSANRFTCEITESVAMEDTKVTHRTFERMRKAGLHVSIDDFGVGQASLSYLRRLPAAELKIDASFVQDLQRSSDACAIVDAVVRLAHALQLRVVAEGVETAFQRHMLVKMGCDEMQGYLFAKPMSAQALSLWAAQENPTHIGGEFRDSLFCDTLPGDAVEL